MLPFLPLALLAQSAATPTSDPQPASEKAILAGAKACIGATVDPAGEDARLQGWANAPAEVTAGMKTDGRVLSRDNVMLIVKPGVDGGCVIVAKADARFEKAVFYSDLNALTGVAVSSDPKQPVTNLPNGEMFIAVVGQDTSGTTVQLVVANPKGKYAKPKGD
jgi:hypothetical protein